MQATMMLKFISTCVVMTVLKSSKVWSLDCAATEIYMRRVIMQGMVLQTVRPKHKVMKGQQPTWYARQKHSLWLFSTSKVLEDQRVDWQVELQLQRQEQR